MLYVLCLKWTWMMMMMMTSHNVLCAGSCFWPFAATFYLTTVWFTQWPLTFETFQQCPLTWWILPSVIQISQLHDWLILNVTRNKNVHVNNGNRQCVQYNDKQKGHHSSGDEIANVNFLRDDIVVSYTYDKTQKTRALNSATGRRCYVLECRFTKFSVNNAMQLPLRRSRLSIFVPIESSYTVYNFLLVIRPNTNKFTSYLAPFLSYG